MMEAFRRTEYPSAFNTLKRQLFARFKPIQKKRHRHQSKYALVLLGINKFIVVDGMGNEDILKQKTKCLKLKLNPTKDQRLEMNRWAGCVRFLYNKTIALLIQKIKQSEIPEISESALIW